MSDTEAQLALSAAATAPREPASFRMLRAVPFRLSVTVPVVGLKLRSLRVLHVGQVLVTEVAAADDVPVWVGGAFLGWAELDSADGRMAIRIIRLS